MRRSTSRKDRRTLCSAATRLPRPPRSLEAITFSAGVTGLVVVAAVAASALAAWLTGLYVGGALLGAGMASVVWVAPASARALDKHRPAARIVKRFKTCRRANSAPVTLVTAPAHVTASLRRVSTCRRSRKH
jgi:hypothetical protein